MNYRPLTCARMPFVTSVLLSMLLFPGVGSAQPKVGTLGDLNGFQHSFYTVRFGGPAASARGGDGVVTQFGASGFLANPANLISGLGWEVYYDASTGRDNLLYKPSFVSSLESSLTQPDYSFGSAAAKFRIGRFTCGLAMSRPRQYTNTVYTTWFDPQVAHTWRDVSQPEIREWQASAGLATNLLPSVRFGASGHLVRVKLLYYSTYRESTLDDYQDSETIGIFQVGLKAVAGKFILALSLKSPEDFNFWRRGESNLASNALPTKVPAELSTGVLYRDLISVEVKTLLLDDDVYEHDFRQVGGGVHLPLDRLLRASHNYLNLGIMYRSNPDYYGDGTDQTFLTAGLEIAAGPVGAYATWINGSALTDSEFAVSEFVLGLKYRSK